MVKWQRSFFQPVLPLGEDGRRVTGSKEHIALSRMAAGEGMVLLKNEKNTLPIRRGTKVALFGKGTVEYIRNLYEGMKIKEDEGKVEVFDKLAKYYAEDIQKQYADGAVPGMTVEPELPDELLNEAREYTDTAIITICRFSGEGWDRKCEAAQDGYVLDGEEKRNSELSAKIFENGDFCLTNAENAMVEKVKKAFPHVIVVMNVGGIVDTKWFRDCDEIQSVLMAWQGGIEGGLATADILCGDVNPSGKLSDTYAKDLEDYPSTANFHESAFYVDYTEDIYVGYRYYDTKEMDVAFPFGYGLSYTTFAYSNLKLSMENPTEKDTVMVSADVTNTGKSAGKEVVQLYIRDLTGSAIRPEKELKGFEKVFLEPGETKTVTMELNKRSFAWYNTELHDWFAASGDYEILVGASSRDIRLTETLHLNSSQRLPMHVHMNTTLGDLLRNPETAEAAKKLIQKYLSGEAGSEAASEAVSEEMTMAMTDSMPLRALMGFAGVSRKELDSVIEKLNK